MSAQEEIKKYMSKISRGVIKLNDDHAKHIVDLALNGTQKVEVHKFRYNGNNDKYELCFTLFIDLETAKAKVHKLTPVKQWQGFYKFEIPALSFQFYTVNNNLFP